MVDLFSMFRRRPAKRGRPGFARQDITALGDSVGGLVASPVRDAPPIAREQPMQASDPYGLEAPPRQRPAAAQPPKARPAAKVQRPGGPQLLRRPGFLAVHSVEKSFGSRQVVRGVSIYVRRGEAVGLLGPNGAGKTTVFYMITGLIKADRGAHRARRPRRHQAADVSARAARHRLSAAGSLDLSRPDRRAEHPRGARGGRAQPARSAKRELDALLDEFNITRLRKSPSIALSGGERRRVEIARALATRPNYMLLDEPFAGIDPIAVGDIQDLVRHLTNRGIGVLITDHNVRETLGLTDRAYIVYAGEILTEGSPDEIVADPDVRRLYLGEEFRL